MADILSTTVVDSAQKALTKYTNHWYQRPKKLILGISILIVILIASVAVFFVYDLYFSPKARLLKDLNLIISKVNNPDPQILTKYDLSADHVKSNQQQLLNGYPSHQIPGLLTVQQTLEQGNKALAKEQLEKVFKIFLLYKTLLPGGPDKITLSDEEKKSTDPEYIYFDRDAFAMFSAVNKEVGIETINLLYKLK